jgi:hypothetical protein
LKAWKAWKVIKDLESIYIWKVFEFEVSLGARQPAERAAAPAADAAGAPQSEE